LKAANENQLAKSALFIEESEMLLYRNIVENTMYTDIIQWLRIVIESVINIQWRNGHRK
jgi:hypothetical protein